MTMKSVMPSTDRPNRENPRHSYGNGGSNSEIAHDELDRLLAASSWLSMVLHISFDVANHRHLLTSPEEQMDDRFIRNLLEAIMTIMQATSNHDDDGGDDDSREETTLEPFATDTVEVECRFLVTEAEEFPEIFINLEEDEDSLHDNYRSAE